VHNRQKITTFVTATLPSSSRLRTVYKTNSWFSSAYHFPSYPLFAFPGAYKFSEQGLSVAYPLPNATQNAVFGVFDEWCHLNIGGKVTDAKITGYGDWNVEIAVVEPLGTWQVSLIQGFPFAYLSMPQKNLHIFCRSVTIAKTQKGVLVTRGQQRMIIEGNGATSVDLRSATDVDLASDRKQYRIAFLPSGDDQVALFEKQAWQPIKQTRMEWQVDPSKKVIQTTYRWITGTNQPLLFTIWPHMQVVSPSLSQRGSYQTVYGELRLVEGNAFTTVLPFPDLPETFSKVTNASYQEAIRSQVQKDTLLYMDVKSDPPPGVYFRGTWLGGLTSLIQLADLYDLRVEREQLLNKLEEVIKMSVTNFTYNPTLHLYVATNAEFGNEKGNDHHFHYGYYIRAAAVLLRFRPYLSKGLSPVIGEMVDDIASTNRDQERYPFLRTFSPYEGHSWADGEAKFDDGNNQESTSEALNAWYAVAIWGKITKNSQTEQTGTWLFAQELRAAQVYWFGINNPFPNGYQHQMASLVWGGKREFATWFSPDPMHIYGIQLLPITPASGYLATLANQRTIGEIQALVKEPQKHEWGDLYTSFLSFFDKKGAQTLLGDVRSAAGMKIRSLLYQTVYQNL